MKLTSMAIATFVMCVAATEWAMRGRHEPTGNTRYLGTEVAGVEGMSLGIDPAVYGENGVSWLVTGTRNDPHAQAHRIVVEEAKPPHEAGKFLHPELYRQPLTQRITPAVRQ